MHIKIALYLISLLMASVSCFAQETYNLSHSKWKDTIIVKNNRFCRKNNDCGSIVHKDNSKIIVKWDKYSKEAFVYSPKDKTWILNMSFLAKDIITKEYEELEYTLQEPYIKLNPYQKTPLSALIKFPTTEPCQIQITIKGKGNAPDIIHTVKGYQTEHTIPILGLFPNHTNKIILTATTKEGKIETSNVIIKTENVNTNKQWFPLKKTDNTFNYYASYDGLIFDEEGNIRYQITDSIWFHSYYYKNNIYIENTNNITKYSMLGEFQQRYNYPKNFYTYIHGMSFKDNDNLLIFGTFKNTTALIDGEKKETHRDFILEIDHKTGKTIATYDLAEMLNPDRSLIVKSSQTDYGKTDWAHTNGIDYDAKNKAIIVSGRHFGIVKISEKTKKPIWWMTPHQLTHKSGRNGDKGDISHLLLTATDTNNKPYPPDVQKGTQPVADFKWPLKTHSVKYAGKGIYSIFDNSGKMYDKSLYTTENSVASVFKIDDKKKTVQQVFLKHLPAYSEPGSSVLIHPKTQELWVTIGDARSTNNSKLVNPLFYRFNQKGEEIYRAVLHSDSNSWIYLIQPFEFYAENNWPTPIE